MPDPTPERPTPPAVLRILASASIVMLLVLLLAAIWADDRRWFLTAVTVGTFVSLPLCMAAWPTGLKR